tara:strand:+ start:5311 stop:6729 length:1419 start_codon:yes stop_codon:yes gene_type:complete
MTTTVTSNLNLAKPDIGSEANNWGNVLNGTIDQIDKAIAQRLVKGVGGGSNVTLSDSESSFAIIEFQGTLSGNIDVKTASNDTKPYIIFNNTSGSYTLTFKSNSGTGVVITQGLKSIVYGDGSNIVEATSPANSFSANKTITLSGVVSGSVATDFSSDPTITTSIVDGSIVNADINTSAAIDASKIADGSVSNTEFQRLDGVTSDIQSQLDGLRHNADDVKIKFGAGDDLEIFHDTSGGGTDNVIQATNTSHSLRLKSDSILLQGASGGTLASFSNGGSVTLSYSNSGKLSTVGTGVSISGDVTATGNINGNGQNLTNLNAANLTGTLPAIDGSALTGIVSAPTTTGIGAIQPFILQRKQSNPDQNANPMTISHNTEVTPSTYSNNPGPYGYSDMIIADYTGQFAATVATGSNGVSFFDGEHSTQISQAAQSSKSGTWRLLGDARYGNISTGSGQNTVVRKYCNMFFMQRIS